MKYVILSFIFVNFLYAFDLSNIPINKYIFPSDNLKGQNKEIQKQLKLCKKNDKFKSLEYLSQWLRTNELNNITCLLDVPVNVAVKSCNNTSWGYNFQAINSQIHTLLTKIAEIYDESSQRVDILDMGCGNAWLAPFILMAGGNYKGV